MASDVANLRRSALTNYDPERGLKEIAVADAGVRHFTRAAKSNDPLAAARNREELYDAIGKKILAQAEYVVWRDSVVVPSQKDPNLRGKRGGFDNATPALPEADPGKIIAHRWRKSYCVTPDTGTAIEPTLLAEAIRDAQEKCIRAVTLAMIDVDASMWVEYDDGDKEPVALMETARDNGQSIKPATVLKRLAQRCFPVLPAYVVLYQVSEGINPAAVGTHDIKMFRIKRIWPEPETPWNKLTPAQWANHLCVLRRWGAHLGETGVRERLPAPPMANGDLFNGSGV